MNELSQDTVTHEHDPDPLVFVTTEDKKSFEAIFFF